MIFMAVLRETHEHYHLEPNDPRWMNEISRWLMETSKQRLRKGEEKLRDQYNEINQRQKGHYKSLEILQRYGNKRASS